MTHAIDRHGNVTYISHTTPAPETKWNVAYAKQIEMTTAIHHYVNSGTCCHLLLSTVVDGCYAQETTIDYLGQDDGSIGFTMRLVNVKTAISNALKAYTFGKKYPS